MTSEDDMDAPVTRRELKQELESFGQQVDQRVDQKLELFEQRVDQKLELFEQRVDQQLDRHRDQLLAELKSHANALHEDTRRMFGVLDDKITAVATRMTAVEDCCEDLQPRVATLERKVFAPRKRSTKRVVRRRR